MPIAYKIDILKELKSKGYSTYKIRQNNLLSQSTLTKFKNNDAKITLDNLESVCKMLDMQPGDLIEYIPD